MTGGLGNQLFQYANARAVACRTHADLLLDVRDLLHDKGNTRCAIGHFNMSARLAEDSELPPARETWIRYMVWRVFGKNPILVRERGLAFNANIRSVRPGSYLHGYFQSERYFEDVADLLRDELRIITPPSRTNADLLARISVENALAIHIRRSDYLSDGNRSVYAACSMGYYTAAITHMVARVGPPMIYVFSDDPDWARENLNFDYPTVISAGNPGERAYEDLRLMAACRNNIIANSTFSWWGAWLNPNPDKIVIAPEEWFVPAHPQNPDIIPAGWLTVPN